MKTNNSLDTYIKESNADIFVYSFLFGIITVILLLICYKTHCYYYLLIDIFSLNSVVLRVGTRFNLNKIEKFLVANNLLNKIGKIEYWNEKNYFLTENYVIILVGKKVRDFSYSDIVSISKEKEVKSSRYSRLDEYLVITLLNGEQYKILSYTTVLTNEKYKDISDFLLEKNGNIIKK